MLIRNSKPKTESGARRWPDARTDRKGASKATPAKWSPDVDDHPAEEPDLGRPEL